MTVNNLTLGSVGGGFCNQLIIIAKGGIVYLKPTRLFAKISNAPGSILPFKTGASDLAVVVLNASAEKDND